MTRTRLSAGRERAAARLVIGGFVLVAAAAAVWSGRTGGDRAQSTGALRPESVGGSWTEPSPTTILLAWAAVWLGSALIVTVSYWLSPGHLRRPFTDQRLARAGSAASLVVAWLSAVIFAAVVTGTFTDAAAVDVLYSSARSLLLRVSVVAGALVALRIIRTWLVIVVCMLTALTPTVLVSALPAAENALDTGAGRLLAMAVVVIIAALALLAVARARFRPTFGWVPPGSMKWRAAFLMVAAGSAAVAVAVSQPVVLHAQVDDLLAHVGVRGVDWDAPSPLFDDHAPERRFSEDLESDLSVETLTERLASVGFEPAASTPGFETIRRPRGDSFDALVVTLSNGGRWFEVAAENTASFRWMRFLRDAGLAFVALGFMLFWQRTSLLKYEWPDSPFERGSPWVESIGWAFVAAAACCVIYGALEGTWILYVLVAGLLWSIGAWLVRPSYRPPPGSAT